MQRILFKGLKSFWKTKNSVEIAIVEHSDFDVFEVIVVDTLGRFEAGRLFLDAILLRSVVEANEGSAKLKSNATGGPEANAELAHEQKICKFICNHLFITNYLPVSKILEVEVRSTYENQEHNELIVQKPADLRPCVSPFTKVEHAFSDGPPGISIRDKWRQPLILARVSKGLPLTPSDAQIWERLVQNKTQQELLSCLTETLVKAVPENQQVLQSAAHAIMLPTKTPFPAPRFKAPSPASLPRDLIGASTPSPSPPSPPPPTMMPIRVGQAGLPPMQPPQTFGGTGPPRRSRLGAILGRAFGSREASPSPGNSAASSQAGSRSASPAPGSRVSRSSSEDSLTGAALTTAHTHQSDQGAPFLGAWKDTLKRNLGLRTSRSYDDCNSIRTTARMTTRTVDDEVDQEGLADSTLVGLDIDAHEHGATGGAKGPTATVLVRGGRKERRHTFDPAAMGDALGTTPVQACGRARQQHVRSGSGSLVTGVTYPATQKLHRRTGSGSLMAGIAGLSNRVHPSAWMENSGEHDGDSVDTVEK